MDKNIKKIKHSKFKNTGLLFELLIRQATSDALSENKDSKALFLIKKYFGKNTLLSKELKLYKTLVETKYNNTENAKELLKETLKIRANMNNKVLKNEKYNLVNDIKNNYDTSDFFKNKLHNYKNLASIYNLFESTNESHELLPNEILQFKKTIIENITISKNEIENVYQKFDDQEDDLKKLTYKLMVENFNKKYKTLDVNQKELLREYIYNASDVHNFKKFVINEIEKIKSKLIKSNEKIDDKVTNIKIKGIIEHIDTIKPKKFVNEKSLISLMKYYELLKEINKV